MRIFIELPSWLGDSVMASASIENICQNFSKTPIKIVFFGAFVSCELFITHPNCEQAIIDKSKEQMPKISLFKPFYRLLYLRKITKNLGKFDIALSFRSHFASKVLLSSVKADKKAIFKPNLNATHQVLKYLNFVNSALNLKPINTALRLHFTPLKKSAKKRLGINAGASYGDAKRWGAHNFAKVGLELAKDYDIFIFGAKSEQKIAEQITKILSENKVNFINLCGKTSIKELCENIAALDLFITNDSGPMHIGAAFKVPMVAIFGPTRADETAPYGNERAKIIKLNLPCQPCMRRHCPLKHHNCMEQITPKMVLECALQA